MVNLGVAFFFDSKKLGRQWSLENLSDQALSGTDYILLDVVLGLIQLGYLEVTLFATSAPQCSVIPVKQCRDLNDSLTLAEKCNCASLVFVADSGEEQKAFLQTAKSSVRLIAWAHCTPSFDWMSVGYQSCSFGHLVTVSNTQRLSLAHHPLFRRSITIPNFVDDSEKIRINDCRRDLKLKVGYIGALKQSKGFHHLANVWPRVREAFPEAKLMVYGSGSLYGGELNMISDADRDYQRQILQPLGGSMQSAAGLGVEFMGSVSKAELFDCLPSWRCAVVNPCGVGESYETFCVSAAEASMSGVPVIGGAYGGLSEVVGHGKSGLLVRNNDELQTAIETLLANRELAHNLGLAGQERIKKYFNRSYALSRWVKLLTGESLRAESSSIVLVSDRTEWWRGWFRCCLPLSMIAFCRRCRRLFSLIS